MLLTFISQARPSSGSQILTIGTFAAEIQTTFFIPSVKVGETKEVSANFVLNEGKKKSTKRHVCELDWTNFYEAARQLCKPPPRVSMAS